MDGKVSQAGIAQAALGYASTALGACLVLLAGEFGVPPEELAWQPPSVTTATVEPLVFQI